MQVGFLTILLALAVGCVKDEGKISQANNAGTTSGGSSAGGSSGGASNTTDPFAAQSWHLKSTGVETGYSATSATVGEDINLGGVHTTRNILGRNVRIAVADSGTDIDHPDLNDNTLPGEHRNYTFSNPTAWRDNVNPVSSDDDAHGTAVAGLIIAEKNNGIGSYGVSPSSKFAAFRSIFATSASTSSRLAKSIDAAYGDFDLFNYSFGYRGFFFVEADETLLEAFELGATTQRAGKGSLYIQSSGNSYDESYSLDIDGSGPIPVYVGRAAGNSVVHTDLNIPYKVVVGATNAAGEKASYSTPGSNLWVSAPGGEYGIDEPAMITTDIRGCTAGFSYKDMDLEDLFNFGFDPLNLQCDYTNIFNGTSSAAPVVTGVVALMLEANPNLTWRDIKQILADTAFPIDFDAFNNDLVHPRLTGNPFGALYDYDYKWTLNNAGYLFSNWYGFGKVDAEAAVERALIYSAGSMTSFEQTKSSSGSWYYDSGDLTGLGYDITDESPNTAADHLIWVGHNLLIESVQIKITSDHPFPGELAVHLVSPSNTESRLLNLNNGIYALDPLDNFLMLSNAFYGEESEGFWRIKVYDGSALDPANVGELINWKILISGRKKTSDVLNPEPPTFISLGSVPLISTETPVFNFSDSTSQLLLSNYEAAVGTNESNESIVPWTSIGLATTGHKFTGLTLNSGQTYYLKIRAKQGTRYSSVQLTTWEAN